MSTPFVTRINKYAKKVLSNGAARIYIQRKEALCAAGFFKNTSIKITTTKNKTNSKVSSANLLTKVKTRSQLRNWRSKIPRSPKRECPRDSRTKLIKTRKTRNRLSSLSMTFSMLRSSKTKVLSNKRLKELSESKMRSTTQSEET